MLDEMFQRNASKFAILLEYENPCSFFRFSFRATLFFPPNECTTEHRVHKNGISADFKFAFLSLFGLSFRILS